MIVARDLRIGNRFNCYRVDVIINAINPTHVEDYRYGGEFAIIDLEPIPLTPEILEACGFNATWYEDYCQYELLISDAIEIYNGDKNGICEAVFECCGTEIYRAKYLHQLQNLHWCLVGKELDIKL